MDLKIIIKIDSLNSAKELIKTIKAIEKEHTCKCTLLEIEIG